MAQDIRETPLTAEIQNPRVTEYLAALVRLRAARLQGEDGVEEAIAVLEVNKAFAVLSDADLRESYRRLGL